MPLNLIQHLFWAPLIFITVLFHNVIFKGNETYVGSSID